jgi:hypothetical protein
MLPALAWQRAVRLASPDTASSDFPNRRRFSMAELRVAYRVRNERIKLEVISLITGERRTTRMSAKALISRALQGYRVLTRSKG